MSLGCDGEIHTDPPPVNVDAIALFLGLYSVIDRPEVDEGKSSGSARLSVIHHLHLLYLAVVAKHVPKPTLLSVHTQPKHADAIVWLRVVPISHVSFP